MQRGEEVWHRTLEGKFSKELINETAIKHKIFYMKIIISQ
jgi:hypothetical protein